MTRLYRVYYLLINIIFCWYYFASFSPTSVLRVCWFFSLFSLTLSLLLERRRNYTIQLPKPASLGFGWNMHRPITKIFKFTNYQYFFVCFSAKHRLFRMTSFSFLQCIELRLHSNFRLVKLSVDVIIYDMMSNWPRKKILETFFFEAVWKLREEKRVRLQITNSQYHNSDSCSVCVSDLSILVK